MANYSFVSGAKFRPFSYQEMLQPLQAYTNEYNTIQESLGELSSKASVYDSIVKSQPGTRAATMYNQYTEDLAQIAEALSKQGLTIASRQSLMDMRKRYGNDIIPIEQAYKKKLELNDQYSKLKAQDNTLITNRPVSSITVDDLISNPFLTPDYISGSTLARQVGTAAQALAKRMQDSPREWKNTMGGQYFESMLQKGYKPQEILMAAARDDKAPKELKDIVESVIESSGIKNWDNREALESAYNYANQGLWQAVGDTQYQIQTNRAYDYAMQEKLAAEKQAAKDKKDKDYPFKPYESTGVTRLDPSKDPAKIKSDIEFVKDYIAGKVDYNKKAKRTIGGDPLDLIGTRGHLQATPTRTEEYYPNRDRLNSLFAKYGRNSVGLLDKLQKDYNSSVIRSNSYKLNITDPELLSKSLRENISSIQRRTGKTGVYSLDDNKKGSQVDLKEINDKFGNNAHLEYDPNIGIIYTGTNKKNETKSFYLDPEVVNGVTTTVKDAKGNVIIKNQYQAAIDEINAELAAGNNENAEYYIDKLMKDIYSKYNSITKVQGTTDSNI